MAIRSIMCCCGQELGSSMMVSMNVEKALKNLGITGVSVDHTAPQVASYPNKIILGRIMDMNELTEKLKEVFGK